MEAVQAGDVEMCIKYLTPGSGLKKYAGGRNIYMEAACRGHDEVRGTALRLWLVLTQSTLACLITT